MKGETSKGKYTLPDLCLVMLFICPYSYRWPSPLAVSKESACYAGDPGSVP